MHAHSQLCQNRILDVVGPRPVDAATGCASSFAGTPAADAGELGLGTTTILYGGNDIGTDWRSGGRMTIGRVLDQDGTWMAVGRFYGLDDSEDSYRAEWCWATRYSPARSSMCC